MGMARYDASTAEITVLTFKEGVLSAVAHDLKLNVSRFALEIDGKIVKLAVEADSLRVVSAMRDGVESSALKAHSFAEIEDTVRTKVLETSRFPTIEFVSTGVMDTEVVGVLTLHGQTHEVRGRRSGTSAEFRLDQRRFGIKPYSAMLGALKIKPEVVVRVTITVV